MRLIEVDQKNKQQYQSFVQNKGSFLQDFEWGDFQRALGKKVYRFAVVADALPAQPAAPEFLATGQFIESRALGKVYLFAPYGPVLRDADPAVLRFFMTELQRRFAKAIFVRIEPQRSLDLSGAAAGGQKQTIFRKVLDLNPHKTLILDLNKSEDLLLAEMHQKTRYNIKLAQREEVQIKEQQGQSAGAAHIPENIFEPIFVASKRAGIRSFPVSYYQALTSFFSAGKTIKAEVWQALHQSELLAANIVIYYQDSAIYLFGGSVDQKRNLMAPYLLHWQIIRNAKAAGIKKYDLWGVEEDSSHTWAGISKFKFGFGGAVKNYAGTYDYVCKPAWYNIYNVLRTLNRKVR